MRIPVITDYIGSTIRVTFVCSGATVNGLWSSIMTASDTLVSSRAGVSSGNGHYYFDHGMPTSPGHYVNEMRGVIDANTYVKFQLIELRQPRVA